MLLRKLLEAVTGSAVTPQTSNLKSSLTRQLKRDEGYITYCYDDATGKALTKGSTIKGYPTIGVGFMIDKSKGGRIPDAVISYWLDYEINERMKAVQEKLPWIVNLDEARQGVLLNMAFQMGVNGLLGFKNTLAMVKNAEYNKAADGMLNSLWAKQTPARAKRLSEQMRTGAWQ